MTHERGVVAACGGRLPVGVLGGSGRERLLAVGVPWSRTTVTLYVRDWPSAERVVQYWVVA